MHLQDYIGAALKKKRKTISKITFKDFEWSQHEKHLYKIYASTKQKYIHSFVQYKTPKNRAIWKAFHVLSKLIKDYEKTTKAKVDLRVYMDAHFQWYGKYTYPAHLISRISWSLYFSHERTDNIPVEIDESIHEQDKILAYLSYAREEPERIVLLSLKHSDIFTKGFLKSRGIKV